jgi:hypothetical protein
MWRLRVWFVDASGTVSYTGAWMRSPNETAIFAFTEALRGLSDAQITHVDVSRRYSYASQVPQGRDRGVGMFVQPAYNPNNPDVVSDAFPMWVPESDFDAIRNLWGYPITARGFVSRAGYDMIEVLPEDGEPQSLDNEYPDDTDDYYLIAIRRNFWHKLLRDARAYNTLSLTLPSEQARRVRLDIRDLFLGVPMREVLERLDRIIELLENGGNANTDEIRRLLLQIIAALGSS